MRSTQQQIPFNKLFIAGRELEYLRQAIDTRSLSADGTFTDRCSSLIESRFDIRKVYLTPSCTSALEMAAILCGLRPGDEVIMPSFTFASTANSVVLRGARPVFVDIRQDTLNIDERLIGAAVTAATRAIIPVHYAGVACEMESILRIAEKRGLKVVEDAAQGVNAFYRGRALGTLGHLGAYSFHATKAFIAGEAGALCINTADLLERAEIVREKGTNRSEFVRGEVEQYTWVDIGSSSLPAEIVSAFLLAQLEAIDSITASRRRAYLFYNNGLQLLETQGLVRLPVVPDHCTPNYHLFHILLKDSQTRGSLQSFLRSEGVHSAFHYIPLPVEHHSRYAGRSTYTFWKSVRVWARLAFSFSAKPLRLVTFLGLGIALLGILIAVGVAFYRYFFPGDFPKYAVGWASLMVVMLLIGGIELMFLGVLGEYVGRTFRKVGRSPQTSVRVILNGADSPECAYNLRS